MAITGVKFNNVIDINGSPGIEGSTDYQPITGTRYYKIGEVIHVSQPQLNYVDNHSEATAKNYDLLKFPNNVKFRLKLWVGYDTIDGQVYQSVKGSVCWVSAAGSEYTEQSWNIGGALKYNTSGHGGPYIQTCPVNVLNAFGFKVLWINDYTSSGVAVEGITDLDNCRLVVFLPIESTQNSGTMRTFVNIASGALLKRQFENSSDPVDESWVFYPGIEQGSAGNSSAGEYMMLSVSALSTMLGYVNRGKNPGDPDLTVDDIITERTPTDDPTQEDDPSQPGGGDGDYKPTQNKKPGGYVPGSDPIDFPTNPTGGPISSGAIKSFVVSPAIMTAVFNKLWSTSIFDIDTFQKLVEAPLDSLIDLECIPVTPSTSGQGNIKLGNFDTEQSAPIVSNQYVTIDCGSVNVKSFWGSALDTEPYTKCSIYLPFVGIRSIHTDDIMNSTVHVKYNIDILTGNLTAQIKCGQSVLYKYPGNCKATVPVTSRVNDAMLSMVKGLGGIAAGGIMGGLAGAGTAAISAAVNVAFSKTHVNRSGDISGSTGLLDDFVPYLIIHRPVQSLAKTFKNNKGYPCNMSSVLSSLSGYTEVEYIHLTGISGATDTELQEIENLLKEGVII